MSRRSTTVDGRNRVVISVEFWADGIRVRWIEWPLPRAEQADFVAGWAASDNRGTVYLPSMTLSHRSGSGASEDGFLDGAMWFHPAAPPGATELRLSWSDDSAGDVTIDVSAFSPIR